MATASLPGRLTPARQRQEVYRQRPVAGRGNALNCVCGAASYPLRCTGREAAVVSGEAGGAPEVNLALADADQGARIFEEFPLAAAGLISAGVIRPLPIDL
jgi:hypothetical protein